MAHREMVSGRLPFAGMSMEMYLNNVCDVSDLGARASLPSLSLLLLLLLAGWWWWSCRRCAAPVACFVSSMFFMSVVKAFSTSSRMHAMVYSSSTALQSKPTSVRSRGQLPTSHTTDPLAPQVVFCAYVRAKLKKIVRCYCCSNFRPKPVASEYPRILLLSSNAPSIAVLSSLSTLRARDATDVYKTVVHTARLLLLSSSLWLSTNVAEAMLTTYDVCSTTAAIGFAFAQDLLT